MTVAAGGKFCQPKVSAHLCESYLAAGRLEDASRLMTRASERLQGFRQASHILGWFDVALARVRLEEAVREGSPSTWREAARAVRQALATSRNSNGCEGLALAVAGVLDWHRGRKSQAGRKWDQAARLAERRQAQLVIELVGEIRADLTS